MQMGLDGYLCAQYVILHEKNTESKKFTTLEDQEASQFFVPEIFTSSLKVTCCKHTPVNEY